MNCATNAALLVVLASSVVACIDDRLVKVDPLTSDVETMFTEPLPSPIAAVRGIAVRSDGNEVAVTDFDNDQIYVFTPNTPSVLSLSCDGSLDTVTLTSHPTRLCLLTTTLQSSQLSSMPMWPSTAG